MDFPRHCNKSCENKAHGSLGCLGDRAQYGGFQKPDVQHVALTFCVVFMGYETMCETGNEIEYETLYEKLYETLKQYGGEVAAVTGQY